MSESESESLKVVIYTATYDTGGQGFRLKRALDRFAPGISAHSVHTVESYFAYPKDVTYNPLVAYPMFEQADVLHFRNGLGGLKRLGHGQPVVLHHHGSAFREYHARIAAEAQEVGAIQIASTIDLTLLEPNVAWLPAPYDLAELASYRLESRPTGPIRIAHAPTNRALKSTNRIMEAVGNLLSSGYDIAFDLIERKPWSECLRRKAKADIYVDQLNLGYGNNALEAWGMGVPVVAGIADNTAREGMLAVWGQLPFYEASEVTLEARLIDLIKDQDLRKRWAARGLYHLEAYHDEAKVAMQLAKVYQTASLGGAN